MRAGRRRERGIALFAAIWLVMALSALALSVTRETQTLTRVAANELAAARAAAAAEAGLARLGLGLAAAARGVSVSVPATKRAGQGRALPRPGEALRLDGTPYAWAYEDAAVTLSVQAERGKLDLATGEQALLFALLARLAPDRAERLATEIVVARERDGTSRGMSWRLEAGDMQSLEDLARLPAASPEIMARLDGLVSTGTGRAEPDPLTAPEAIFRLLDLDEDTRRRLAALRRRAQPVLLGREPERFTLRAVARLPGGITVERAALVEIAAGRDDALRLIERVPALLRE
ncbi:MAG: hypothetical protein AAF074_08275 [Pseudomonadota bacterium]